ASAPARRTARPTRTTAERVPAIAVLRRPASVWPGRCSGGSSYNPRVSNVRDAAGRPPVGRRAGRFGGVGPRRLRRSGMWSRVSGSMLAVVLLGCSAVAHAAGRSENRFGAIHIDGRKAGQIHYTIEYGDGGDVETLRTRASLSILGVKLVN